MFVVLLSSSVNLFSQIHFNGSFEGDSKPNLHGWTFYYSPKQKAAYPVSIDTINSYKGKYSLNIKCVTYSPKDYLYGMADYGVVTKLKGKTVTLKGYIKTTGITEGYAGLWIRVDGKSPKGDPYLAYANMEDNGIKGDTDWKEYSLTLPYDTLAAKGLHFGAMLIGNGEIWLDDVRLFIDHVLVDKIEDGRMTQVQQNVQSMSGIDTLNLSELNRRHLAWLCELWGFLKYHHSGIAENGIDMDHELFEVIKVLNKANTDLQAMSIFREWINHFGDVDDVKVFAKATSELKLQSTYPNLFTEAFPKDIRDKLQRIKLSTNNSRSRYIKLLPTGSPDFRAENTYTKSFPDLGMRLLSLFRYWNIIQYYYPFRDLLTTKWESVLSQFILTFSAADDDLSYTLAMLNLSTRIEDTHANVRRIDLKFEDLKGKYRLPIKTNIIENKLVVIGHYPVGTQAANDLVVGDIIEEINGVKIEKIFDRYSDLRSASNGSVKAKLIAKDFIERSTSKSVILSILRNRKKLAKSVDCILIDNQVETQKKQIPKQTKIKNISPGIAYLLCSDFYRGDFKKVQTTLDSTKGLILDMRDYPSDWMLDSLVNYLKSDHSAFARLSRVMLNRPGNFHLTDSLKNGPTGPDSPRYKGKVIILVNEDTQSQAEYATMAFQSSSNSVVLGSQTAGADGDVAIIPLPGSLFASITSIGVFYPDGSQTQKVGVKINVHVRPTIKGIMENRDELLERAIKILNEK